MVELYLYLLIGDVYTCIPTCTGPTTFVQYVGRKVIYTRKVVGKYNINDNNNTDES